MKQPLPGQCHLQSQPIFELHFSFVRHPQFAESPRQLHQYFRHFVRVQGLLLILKHCMQYYFFLVWQCYFIFIDLSQLLFIYQQVLYHSDLTELYQIFHHSVSYSLKLYWFDFCSLELVDCQKKSYRKYLSMKFSYQQISLISYQNLHSFHF